MEVEARWIELFEKKPQVIKPGLERMRRALAHLEKIDRGAYPPIVLVGGTNGKGSTSGYLYQLLAAEGSKVGLFSSPHLCSFAERIQLSFRQVRDEELWEIFLKLKENLGASLFEELSFFEINTLLARQVFLESKAEIWILEVGMGGRWDATNVFDPIISVITSIGLDHMEYLGPTTSAIAREKSGIMRRNRVTIWGGLHESDAFAHQEILLQAREKQAILRFGERDFKWIKKIATPDLGEAEPLGTSEELLWVEGQGAPLDPPGALKLAPRFLKQNFLKAFATYDELYKKGLLKLSPEEALQKFSGIPKPPTLWARFHEMDLEHLSPQVGLKKVLFDVAHNPQGAQALVTALKGKNAPYIDGLISILGDKDINEMLDFFRPVFQSLVLFRCSSDRAFRKEQLALRHQDLPFAENFKEALMIRSQSLGQESSKTALTVIAGSVYAIGEVLSEIGIEPLGKRFA